MSDIVERLNKAIMQGPIKTPAWIINTMRDAKDHIALLEAEVKALTKADIRSVSARELELEQRIAEQDAELAALREQLVLFYNRGYNAGHHDTVEAVYVPIFDCDMKTYHADVVNEYLQETGK